MNWKFTLFIVLYLSALTPLYSQDLLHVKKSDFVEGVKERKNVYGNINKALEIYRKGEGFLDKVIPLLKDAYRLNNKNAELNYNLGVCHLIYGPKNEALSYFKEAQELKADISEDIHFLLGVAHQYRNEFDKAIVQYKINIELTRQNNYKEKLDLIALSEKRIAECKNGKNLLARDSKLEIERLDDIVNSEYDEFNPILIEGILYFSSRRGDEKSARSSEDQKFYEKIFTIDSIGKVSQLPINTPNKSNVAYMTKSTGNSIIYSGAEGNGDVFYTKESKNKWIKDKPVKFINESKSKESSVSFCKDGNEVYFVSNRKGGFGNFDIYYSVKDKKEKWSKPINIGGDINTEFDECDVFVTEDGSEMYFSSKGHNSMGGYDIFKCTRTASGDWSIPKNMGYPVNSTDNDITFFKSKNGEFYFASERFDGSGGFDIYREKEVVKELPNKIIEEKISTTANAIPIAVPDVPIKSKAVGIEEVKMKQELVQEDFVYRVQIAACRKEMGPKDLFQRYKGGDVIEHLYVEGWHKYTIGGFETFEEAAQHRDNCGVDDAFVVLFKGGYRLGIAKRTGGLK